MATSNRDVKMTLSVDTLGEEGIKSLETEIRKLAKGAGEAAPEFERLADEVGQLASQAGAVRGLENLANEVERLGTEQAQAATKAEELRTRLAAQQATVDAAATRQRELAAALRDARNALTDTNADLQIARRGTDEAAKGTEAYERAITGLIEKKAVEKKAVDEARDALNAANKELTEATSAQRRLAGQTEAAEEALTKVGRAIDQQNKALAAGQDELRQYGLSTDNLATAQGELLQRLNASGAAARQQGEALRDAAETASRFAEISQRNAQIEADAAAQRAAAAERDAEIDRQQESILQQNLARREAVAQRRAALARETAAAEAAAADRAQADDAARLREQYAAEEAASNRIIGLKREAYARIAALAKENAEKEAAAARQAVEALSNAFDTVGVRGVQAVEREIRQVRDAMELVRAKSGETGAAISGAMRAGEERINALQREIRELTGQLTLADRAADLFRNSLGQIAAGNLIADAVASIVERVKELGREFFRSNIEVERLTRTLTLVTGSSEAAAQKIEFLRDVARTAGISVSGITDSFIKFQASASAAGLSADQVDRVFKSITVAAGRLGLSSDAVSGSLEALSQIAGKGTVSLEELRGQLGDRFPAAMSITAKGLGVTQAELIKLVETGRLASEEFFPAFIKGLEDTFGAADQKVTGLAASINNLKTAFTVFFQQAQDSAPLKALSASIQFLADNLNGAVAALKAVAVAFAGIKIAEYVASIRLAAVATGTTLVGALTGAATAARAFWVAIGGPVGLVIAGLTAVIAYYKEIYQWLQSLTKAGREKAAQEAAAAKAAEEAAKKEEDAARLKAKLDEEQAIRDRRAILDAQERSKETVRQQELAEKGVKTAEAEAKAITELANRIGDEAEKRKLAITASELLRSAKEREADASRRVISALEAELQAIEARRRADGTLVAALEEQRKKTAELLAQKKELLERTEQEVRAAEEEVQARRMASEVYRDNSARVIELREAYEQARAAYDKLATSGIASSEQLTNAMRRLADATTLYADAAEDARQKQEALTDSKRAAVDLQIVGLQYELEEARNWEARAKRLGDEEGVRRALIRQKEIELEITKLQIELQRVEAEGAIAVAKAKLEEARVTGTLTDAKRIELETEIKIAEIKLKQADVREVATQRIQEEIQALRSSKEAVDGERDAIDSNTDSWNENIKAREKAIQLAKAARGEFAYDEQGFRMEADGSRSAYTVGDANFVPTGLPNGQFNTGRLTQGQIMANVARNGGRYNPADTTDGNLQGVGFAKPKSNTPSTAQSGSSTGDSARDAARYELARYGVGVSDSAPLQQILQLLAEKRGSGSTVTRVVKIDLGGRTSTVNVASDADAEALAAVFRQLETAAGRG